MLLPPLPPSRSASLLLRAFLAPDGCPCTGRPAFRLGKFWQVTGIALPVVLLLGPLPRPSVASDGEANKLQLGMVLGTTTLTAKSRQCHEKLPPLPPNQDLINLVNYGLEEGI